MLVLTALVAAAPAYAAECGRYTSESRPAGEVVATMKDDRTLEIADAYSGTVSYDLVSAGTGLPYEIAVPKGGTPESEDARPVLEHKGDLIIDMMPFVPFCE